MNRYPRERENDVVSPTKNQVTVTVAEFKIKGTIH